MTLTDTIAKVLSGERRADAGEQAMTCMRCDTNHRDPQDHPHTTTTEALCKYIREREAAAVAAAYQKAADAAYIAVYDLVFNHDSEYALDADDAGHVAEKAILALTDSAPKDAKP